MEVSKHRSKMYREEKNEKLQYVKKSTGITRKQCTEVIKRRSKKNCENKSLTAQRLIFYQLEKFNQTNVEIYNVPSMDRTLFVSRPASVLPNFP